MMPLEKRFAFTAGASVVLSFLGERGPGKDSIRVTVRFFNNREFDLGMNEITAALGAFQHPVRH
jgi:hypothetical protein